MEGHKEAAHWWKGQARHREVQDTGHNLCCLLPQEICHTKEGCTKTGKLLDDKDFEVVGLGKYCEGDIRMRERVPTHIFRAWFEEWEKHQFSSRGDDLFAEAIVAKYASLQFLMRIWGRRLRLWIQEL